MSRSNPVLLIAAVCVLPLGAAAKVALTLTPAEAPIRITETGDFTAVVTGNVTKTVTLQVCDGFGANCVTGGSTTLGTIVEIGRDASNNPIGRYTAPATLPPSLACQSVVLGCQVKVRGILKFTKNGRKQKKISTATVVLAAPGVIRRASVATDGSQANDGSSQPRVSVDGRFVVFGSTDTNLVTGDTNNSRDIFLRDTCGELEGCSPTTIRASVANDDSEANADSAQPGVSADGRFVAFQSAASNLTVEATGGFAHIFVRDTCLGAGSGCTTSTTMVSRATDGTVANADNLFPAISADGRYVAFLSDADNLVAGDVNGAQDAFVRDTCAGVPTGCSPSTTRVSVADNGSEGNSASGRPSLSADGRLVVFASAATNLVGGDANGVTDVFVRDTCFGASGPCTPSTTRVSLADDGSEANLAGTEPSISADGRFVTFASGASNLVGSDTNGAFDVFVRDTCFGAGGCTAATTRVSVASDGTEGDFGSGTGFFGQAISADGRFVTFHSSASTLVGNDFNSADDIFVRDTCAGTPGCTPSTVRVSVAVDGAEGDATSLFPHTSPDGRFVVFQSGATNLLGGGNDTNNANDIAVARTSFVRPPLAYVAVTASTVTASNDVVVFDTETNTVVATTGPLSGIDDPIGVALSPDDLRAYVTLQFSNEVVVLNTLTNTEVARIAVGSGPIIPAVTPDGTRVYVPNEFSNNVMVIDTGTNTVTATIGVGSEPLVVVITTDGKRAYVSNFASNNVKVIDTHPASGTFHTVLATIAVGTGPAGLAFSPDGLRLYVANSGSNNVSVINTSTNGVVATITVGTGPLGVALTPDGSRLYVVNNSSDSVSVINTATNNVIATISVPDRPEFILIAPDGPTLYLTHDSSVVGAVTVISAASNSVVGSVPIGGTAVGIAALRLVR